MDHGYGIESHGDHPHTPHRKPVRYIVVIDSAGSALARLFLESREQVGEIDAGTEEVAAMTAGLHPAKDADGPAWDRALQGHSPDERRAADVYTLPV
ncbi:MAG: hypothetical protein ABIV63_14790 [Caldimonas sp.]